MNSYGFIVIYRSMNANYSFDRWNNATSYSIIFLQIYNNMASPLSKAIETKNLQSLLWAVSHSILHIRSASNRRTKVFHEKLNIKCILYKYIYVCMYIL